MSRCIFEKGDQGQFLSQVKEKLNLSWGKIARRVNLSPRTIRDWEKEKFIGKKEILLKLSEMSNIALPPIIEERREWWSAYKHGRKGALSRLKIYGPPGTPESRKKGGLVSQQRRRENPEYYRRLGCIVRNEFKTPKPSMALAEFVGIMLGDGAITDSQVTISLSLKNDVQYGEYVKILLEKLFGRKPSVYKRIDNGTLIIQFSGVNFIEFCLKMGLVKGNKIRAQVDIPGWIKNNSSYYIACLRGLFDTDGCIYLHKHWTKGIRYRNLGLCFTSHSKPLLHSFNQGLLQLSFKTTIKPNRVFMYSQDQIQRFFEVVKPKNQYQVAKLRYHISNSRRLS